MNIMDQKAFFIILGLLIFSISANAQDKTFDVSVLSEKGRQAYQKLLKVELFAVDGIGYGGQSSEGYIAFNALLVEDKKNAIKTFKSLVKDATVEGGLYGLLGSVDITI